MLKVANKKVIRKLSFRSFRTNKTRNIIAYIAIALTTILFTSLFTVVISMNYTMQQQTMRMTGSSAHGVFKYLSEKQMNELKNHPLIKEYGTTLLLSQPVENPFHKYHAEIRYSDENGAKRRYSYPTTGRMPMKYDELATDTKVLDLLGIPHKIGQTITLTYPLGNEIITDTFTLCGFWKKDEAIQVSQIWISKDYVAEKVDDFHNADYDGFDTKIIGTWSLELNFQSSSDIIKNLYTIAKDLGYTLEDRNADNFLESGVNWAYTSTHLNSGDRMVTKVAIGAIIILIMFTGYLIIYNIFQISITNDIRFYGMLKTIGTTGKQIKRIIRYQAIILSCFGIPFGLLIGYIIGSKLTKLIMSTMQTNLAYISLNLWIFIGSALFSLITVIISTRKPGKMAASVSPIEALRYVEQNTLNKTLKKNQKGSKVIQMARANLMRNRKKTIIVILSLSLSIVLFNSVFTITKGFNMDKYLSKFVISDFIVGHADYFRSNFNNEDQKVTESIISAIHEQEGITNTGKVYFSTVPDSIYQTKKNYMEYHRNYPPEFLDPSILSKEDSDIITMPVDIYGLEKLPLSHLKIVEGSVDIDQMIQERGMIQIIHDDDYGNPMLDYKIYEVGDTVKVHYTADYTIDENGDIKEKNGYDLEYKIVATAVMPNSISVRYYGSVKLAMLADTMHEDMKTLNNHNVFSTMNYMVNISPEHEEKFEKFIKDYTSKVEGYMNYESKNTIAKEFQSFQNMFLLVGSVLSFIIGLIGIMNFINTEVTSIMTRRRELAMLNSIGMTGKQIKRMLILEGLYYGATTIGISLLLSILTGYLIIKPMENMLWFFKFEFTIAAILVLIPVFAMLGIIIPLAAYKTTNKKSIVERLREVES